MYLFETERLNLRKPELRDAEFLIQLMNDPDYYKNIGDRGIRTVEDAERYIRERLWSGYEKHGYGIVIVEMKTTRQPIGFSGLVKRDSLEFADVAIAILREHWGTGYATEAARGSLEWARKLGMQTVFGLTAPHNKTSMHILEKIGLKNLGELLLPDFPTPSTFFRIDFSHLN